MKNLSDLKEIFGSIDKIPYSELLNCLEWKRKREKIISRDRKKCQQCLKEGFDLYKDKPVYKKGVGWIVISVPANVEDIIEEDEFGRMSGYTGAVEVDNPVYLHVHHIYYILGKHPWEYDDEALMTVCSDCHSKIHKNNIIPVYVNEDKVVRENLTPCFRCSGEGEFPHYKHVDNGICFRCGGAKYEELIRSIDKPSTKA